MPQDFDILYQDEQFVAIHKPVGWLVHPEASVVGAKTCLKHLKRQLKRYLYPVHRIDRATSGVLLFALSSEIAAKMAQLFLEHQVQKTYLAVVRGHMPESGLIDHALKPDPTRPAKEAVTAYRCLAKTEIDAPVGRYATARYSLVEFTPQHGRRHQLRRHAAHLSHPIVGDTTYGDGRQNRFFRDRYGVHRLLLMATKLAFTHPETGVHVEIEADLSADVSELFLKLGLKTP